jgi:LDH2 family malate/lactate/ureidoglycolate dehydrogenase
LTVPIKYQWDKLQFFCRQVFEKAGVSPERAEIVADSLVQADLRGVDSHGVVRTAIYLKRVEAGLLDPHSHPKVMESGDVTAIVDGRNNFGAVVGMTALEFALQRAKEKGAAVVGVKASKHIGTGAYYALKAIEKNMILIVMSNASQTMPPTGGIRPFIGTNPLCVGIPAGRALPYVLDMATSVVARGKIIVASQKQQSIPAGWAIDKDGNPTTDADEALNGSVLPLGGPKGYAISMFIDILAGVLTGAGFGKYVNNMYENWEQLPSISGDLFQ